MHRNGFNSIQKGKDMNTLITCNQFKEMEETRQNRLNRFLAGCPNRIGSGEPPSLTVADWSPEVDISEDDHGYLLKADLPEMKKDDVRITVEDGILSVSGERKSEKEDQKKKFHRIERSHGTLMNFIFTKNIGMLLLAIYLIVIGLSTISAIAISGVVTGVLALAAGIFILIGR